MLLRIARGRRRVAEIGTGTAWTAAALALADRERRVLTLDPRVRPERDRYLELAGRDAASRIEFVAAGGEDGPPNGGWQPDMLFVDGSHDRELTVRTFRNWQPALGPGAIVAFHDFDNPAYPGVTEAIRELRLEGGVVGDVFVWRS